MENKFPIVNVFKDALAAPLTNTNALMKSFALLFSAFGITVGYAISEGITMDIIKDLPGTNDPQLIQQYGVPVIVSFLLGVFLIGSASAYIFNLWVRYGAFGADGVAFQTKVATLSAIFVNMLKFTLISILIVIVTFVVKFALGLIDVGLGPIEQNALIETADLAGITAGYFIVSLINLLVASVIYSLVSANLTQTALNSDKEGLDHPHTVDFTVVLFLLYLVVFVPSILMGLTGNWALSIAVQAIGGIYVALSVAVAHGLRYSICTADMPDDTETDDEDKAA